MSLCYWGRERTFILHPQNLPLPLRLWTSIKPFITPPSNFSIFPNTANLCLLWQPEVNTVVQVSCPRHVSLSFSSSLSRFITYFLFSSFFLYFLTLLLLIKQPAPPASVCDLTTRFISSHSPDAPTIHEIKSHGIGLGRNALLRCEAAAVPAPTYEWYKSEKRWDSLVPCASVPQPPHFSKQIHVLMKFSSVSCVVQSPLNLFVIPIPVRNHIASVLILL